MSARAARLLCCGRPRDREWLLIAIGDADAIAHGHASGDAGAIGQARAIGSALPHRAVARRCIASSCSNRKSR